MKIGELGGNVFLRIGSVPPLQLGQTEYHQKMQITYLKNCLFTFNFFSGQLFPFSFVDFDRKQNHAEENT